MGFACCAFSKKEGDLEIHEINPASEIEMETYQAIILGILQGLTEFLPVSSSGHLALGQCFFGMTEPNLFFDVSLHMGTLFAVGVVFWKEIISILNALMSATKVVIKGPLGVMPSLRQIWHMPDFRVAFFIGVGSLPTAVLGLFFKQYVDLLFRSIPFVGCMLLITGTFLWFTRKNIHASSPSSSMGHNRGIMAMGWRHALFIGTCQGLAVLPGISRSGATITAALFSGIDRETAARFSFLLSIPAIVGAELLSMKDFFSTGIELDSSIVYGTLISFVVGYLALIVLLRIVKNGKLYLFAPYCWVLGGIAVVMGAAS